MNLSSSMSSQLPSPTPNRPSSSSSGSVGGWGSERKTATAKSHKFLRRLLHYRHMDFEFAFWQTVYLFLAPQKVYRNFQYRKQTKDQFARDDPAFLVLLGFWLVVSSIGFSLVLRFSFLEFLKFLLWVIFIDCIGVGILIASSLWLVSNRLLRRPQSRDQDVEWGYSFDVHLNAFFPLLIILHVFQLFFCYFISNSQSTIACIFGNTLWLIAIGYYIYITFLGYSALPILQSTQVLLYPLTVVAVIYLYSILAGWSISLTVMEFYRTRVR